MPWKFKNLSDAIYQVIDIYRNYLVLLFLIVLSLLLLQTNFNPQLTRIRQVVVYLSAAVGSKFSANTALRNSDDKIHELEKENIELAQRNVVLEDAYIENVKLRRMLKFSERFPMNTIPAQIIFKAPKSKLTYLTLNKGSRDGVRPHQNVITERGVVGLISDVAETYSVCQILLDPSFRAAAKIQRTRLDGILFWQGQPNEVGFYGILKNLDVRVGDVILTSEYSEFFLPNFCIGVVSGINNEISGIFKDIHVQTSVDFNRLEEVFIISDTTRVLANKPGFENVFFESE